jgi:hypothetical protein
MDGEPTGDLTDAERGLLAAAAAGPALDGRERAELAALLRRSPAAAAELAELRAVVTQLEPLRASGTPWEETTSPELAARVAAVGEGPVAVPVRVPGQRRPERSRGRVAALALAACGLLLVGGLGGSLLRGALDGRPAVQQAVEGPAGTLGAVEDVPVATTSSAVTATAAVVAHTWGTETVLDMSGLAAGQTYQVVVVDEAGAAVVAGTFIGTEGTVDCTMNAAVLRQDADRLEVLDASGAAVITSDLPPVTA